MLFLSLLFLICLQVKIYAQRRISVRLAQENPIIKTHKLPQVLVPVTLFPAPVVPSGVQVHGTEAEQGCRGFAVNLAGCRSRSCKLGSDACRHSLSTPDLPAIPANQKEKGKKKIQARVPVQPPMDEESSQIVFFLSLLCMCEAMQKPRS